MSCRLSKMETMLFDGALQAMREGSCVARKEWLLKGQGIWIFLMPSFCLDSAFGQNMPREARKLLECRPQQLLTKPTFALHTKDGFIHFGWLATHCDQLADDWVVVTQTIFDYINGQR